MNTQYIFYNHPFYTHEVAHESYLELQYHKHSFMSSFPGTKPKRPLLL